jgi:hypothetical protein
MTDESKRGLDALRGSRAESLLNDEILNEAFTKLRETYIQAWQVTSIDDVTGREKLFLAVNIIGKVRDHLIAVMNDGKVAASDIARAAERQKSWHEIQ